jgi:hypothetical protein
LTKFGKGYILGALFTKASGHSGASPVNVSGSNFGKENLINIAKAGDQNVIYFGSMFCEMSYNVRMDFSGTSLQW